MDGDTSTIPSASGAKGHSEEKLVTQFTAIIMSRLEDDKLSLPALPSSIIKAMELVRTADFDTAKVADVIEKEPLMAAQVIRLANSAAYAAAGVVTNLKSAMTRIGQRAVRQVVTECGAERMFVSRDKRIMHEAAKVWRHSLAVALVARDLRAFDGAADFDEAYLGGLLHDIGKPVVAGMLLAAEKQIIETYSAKWIGSELWAKVLNRTHRKVGVAIAERWQLPEAVLGGIRESSDYDPSNRQSLGNTVCFANAVAKQCGISTQDDKAEAEALLMIGKSMLGIDDELVTKVSNSLEARVGAPEIK